MIDNIAALPDNLSSQANPVNNRLSWLNLVVNRVAAVRDDLPPFHRYSLEIVVDSADILGDMPLGRSGLTVTGIATAWVL